MRTTKQKDREIFQPSISAKPKTIYAYTIPGSSLHAGYIKIGITEQRPEDRIREQTGTAGLTPELLFSVPAVRSNGEAFHDTALHGFLELHNCHRGTLGRAREWFYFNGNPERAEELTYRFINCDYDDAQTGSGRKYILRPEQQAAVQKTLQAYLARREAQERGENPAPVEFLWNAKPRFGKTLTAYDFVKETGARHVLIVTNRPAVADSWFTDFKHFVAPAENAAAPAKGRRYFFVSDARELGNDSMSREQYIDMLANKETDWDSTGMIAFVSLQDLKGARVFGGRYDKLEWIAEIDWDIFIIDEAHEGVDTMKTETAFDKIRRNFTLHLSGTPFKALQHGKFASEHIFNWTYMDEQEAKESWPQGNGRDGDENPYADMPQMHLFSYRISPEIRNRIEEGIDVEGYGRVNYGFSFKEMFRTKENGRFVHEEEVRLFLDNLCEGGYPFGSEMYRESLAHTFWLLPRITGAKALERMLREHPFFRDYAIVLVAGDGRSLEEIDESGESSEQDEATNNAVLGTSLERVRRAIAENERTITISVGQLTTGVTVPEWTGVLMLSNIQSPSLYFQTAFRAQSPYNQVRNGESFAKKHAYVFDFAPERTLRLFDRFANGLCSGTTKETENLQREDEETRRKNILRVLNFFPVVAEDEAGTMYELDMEEVLILPQQIAAREVVRCGFMSNFLFSNVANIFHAPEEIRRILERLNTAGTNEFRAREERAPITVQDVPLDEEGNIRVPDEIVIQATQAIFGPTLYTQEAVNEVRDLLHESPLAQVLAAAAERDDSTPAARAEAEEREEEAVKETASLLVKKEMRERIEPGLDTLRRTENMTRKKAERIRHSIERKLTEELVEPIRTYHERIEEIRTDYDEQKKATRSPHAREEIEKKQEWEEQKAAAKLMEATRTAVQTAQEDAVRRPLEDKEKKKKKETEDEVRSHLRGFARAISACLMAYGDEDTCLANFDEKIPADVFAELTDITPEQFRMLRDGFDVQQEDGRTKHYPGFFDAVVFDAAVQEFMRKRNEVGDYFRTESGTDIFNYIPPQKNNQIFTPREVVQRLLDTLEQHDPDIFRRKELRLLDMHTKSGLFLAEAGKRLYRGLAETIPNEEERIRHILTEQLYAFAPTEITYRIVRSYVYGNRQELGNSHIAKRDLTAAAIAGNVENVIKKEWGKNMKFDIIIGNPPYQGQTLGDNETYAPPVYHRFLDAAYELADKVTMIHPARFLFNAGSTPKEWNRRMLKNPHLEVAYYYPNSSEVFPNTEIKGGGNNHLFRQEYNAFSDRHFYAFTRIASNQRKGLATGNRSNR